MIRGGGSARLPVSRRAGGRSPHRCLLASRVPDADPEYQFITGQRLESNVSAEVVPAPAIEPAGGARCLPNRHIRTGRRARPPAGLAPGPGHRWPGDDRRVGRPAARQRRGRSPRKRERTGRPVGRNITSRHAGRSFGRSSRPKRTGRRAERKTRSHNGRGRSPRPAVLTAVPGENGEPNGPSGRRKQVGTTAGTMASRGPSPRPIASDGPAEMAGALRRPAEADALFDNSVDRRSWNP